MLILCGDTPLLRAEEIGRVLEALDTSEKVELALMSCLVDDPAATAGSCVRRPARCWRSANTAIYRTTSSARCAK